LYAHADAQATSASPRHLPRTILVGRAAFGIAAPSPFSPASLQPETEAVDPGQVIGKQIG
jgi:hypothetical protein